MTCNPTNAGAEHLQSAIARLNGFADSSSYLKTRTALTFYQTQDKQLAIQKRKGTLVDRARAEALVLRLARQEWRDSGVALTCLIPRPTDTPIFTRPENLLADSPIAKYDNEDDVTMVARAGYDAVMTGDKVVVPRFTNKLIAMFASIVPQSILAEMQCRSAKPE